MDTAFRDKKGGASMFAGFNLKIKEDDYLQYEDVGRQIFEESKYQFLNTLKEFTDDGVIDGLMVQEHWFPNIKADVFISHSHIDQRLALSFAGWLKSTFGLISFVDSCVWGSADSLLKEVDKDYCFKPKTGTYDYNKRNFSTSHIHAILSGALLKMIDNVECVFLLNTNNSLLPAENTIKNQTFSPWIYLEIIITELIRKKKLIEYRMEKILEFENVNKKELRIKYDVRIDHLITVDDNTLQKWVHSKNNKPYGGLMEKYLPYLEKHPLDYLYDLVLEK